MFTIGIGFDHFNGALFLHEVRFLSDIHYLCTLVRSNPSERFDCWLKMR